MTDLQDKAINIKGNDYVAIDDRKAYFNEHYTNGCIRTHLISQDGDYIVKAQVVPDVENMDRYFTGYACVSKNAKDFALEDAETSAVGRALGMMSVGVITKTHNSDNAIEKKKDVQQQDVNAPTPKQINILQKNKIDHTGMTRTEASKAISAIFDGTYKKDTAQQEDDDVINPSDIPF